MRRRRPRRSDAQFALAEWERRWALGEPLPGDDAGEPFFLDARRGRAVLAAVHGVSFAEWLRQDAARLRPGAVLYRSAHLGHLTPVEVVVLEAGGDPWR